MKYQKIVEALDKTEHELLEVADKVSAADKRFLARVLEDLHNIKDDLEYEGSTTEGISDSEEA